MHGHNTFYVLAPRRPQNFQPYQIWILSYKATDSPLFEMKTLSLHDYDITTEEIKGIVKNLKRGKAGGLDNILPEHIIYGGDYLILWLK